MDTKLELDKDMDKTKKFFYIKYFLFCFILLTHEGLDREVYQYFQCSLPFSAGPVPRVV